MDPQKSITALQFFVTGFTEGSILADLEGRFPDRSFVVNFYTDYSD